LSICSHWIKPFFQCIRDCKFSRPIWLRIGFTDPSFFASDCVAGWLKDGTKGSNAITFSAGLWWTWRCRNYMWLNNKSMILSQLSSNIKNSVEDIRLSFSHSNPVVPLERHIRWNINNNNNDCAVFNVDGSCIGNPTRAGFSGIIRNSVGFYLEGFSGFLPSSSDTLQAELTTVFYGLSMAK